MARETLEQVRAQRDAARTELEDLKARLYALEAQLSLIATIVEKANAR